MSFNENLFEDSKVFDNLHLGILIVSVSTEQLKNFDLYINYTNKAFLLLFNINEQNYCGKLLSDNQFLFNENKQELFYQVAVNGVKKEFFEYNQLLNKHLKYSCYQIKELSCCCVIEDISDQYQIKLNAEKYKKAIENTHDVVFEFDPINKTIFYTKIISGYHNLQHMTNEFPQGLIHAKFIHPDDEKVFLNKFIQIINCNSNSANVRILSDNNKYLWNKIMLNNIIDENKKSVIVGFIKNIDEKKRHELRMEFKIKSDGFTGLYNKETTEELISNFLSNKNNKRNIHAMLMIDIDNFKEVNDCLGHTKGDSLLLEITRRIKSVFRKEDIIGRIGGDEFMVFMKDVMSLDSVKSKVEALYNILQDRYVSISTNFNITISMGIAINPIGATNFVSLYKKADTALYQAKRLGKNQHCVYDEHDSNEIKISQPKDIKNSIMKKNITLNVADSVVRLLYKSKDPEKSICSVLELLSRNYLFKRGFIYESNQDDKFFLNTYNWIAPDIDPHTYHCQIISNSIGVNLNRIFNQECMYINDFMNTDVSIQKNFKNLNIKSMFLYPMLENNHINGLIGFDNPINIIDLRNEDIQELSIICNILALFIFKNSVIKKEKELVI